MGKMDERGETCSSRAGEKGLAAAAAVRAAPPSDPLAALLSNLSPEGSALLAKPEVLQAVLAAYSPGASASGPSPTLVCLVCKKAGRTGTAVRHMYRQCPLLQDKNPEEKGKLIGEARSHYGKPPSRHAPGGKGKGKVKGKDGEGRKADPSKPPPPPSLPPAPVPLRGFSRRSAKGFPPTARRPPRPPPARPSWVPPPLGAPSSLRASRSPACHAPTSSSCCAARTTEGNLGLPLSAMRSRNFPRAPCVPFVRSDANLADFFTKPLKPRRFFELRDKIMNIKSPVMNITFPNAS